MSFFETKGSSDANYIILPEKPSDIELDRYVFVLKQDGLKQNWIFVAYDRESFKRSQFFEISDPQKQQVLLDILNDSVQPLRHMEILFGLNTIAQLLQIIFSQIKSSYSESEVLREISEDGQILMLVFIAVILCFIFRNRNKFLDEVNKKTAEIITDMECRQIGFSERGKLFTWKERLWITSALEFCKK